MGCVFGKPRAAVLTQIDFGEKAAQLAKADEARAAEDRVAREAAAALRRDRAKRLHRMYEIDACRLTNRLEALLNADAEVATLRHAPGRRGYFLGCFSDRGGDVDTFVSVHLAPRVAPFEVLYDSLDEMSVEWCGCRCVLTHRYYAVLPVAGSPVPVGGPLIWIS